MRTFYSNCMIYAVLLWLRLGGVLLITRSRSGPFPHFMWAEALPPRLPVRQFVPVRRRARTFPPLLFRGRVATFAGPQPYERGFQWALLIFWLGYFATLALSIGLAIKWLTT